MDHTDTHQEGMVSGVLSSEALEQIAAAATQEIHDELLAARDRLTAMLTPDQMTAFNAYDDLLVLEEQLLQDAMARMVCGG